MRHWLRSHLTYANVMATLAVFLVIGGGAAAAAFVVSSNNQVAANTISGHHPPGGKHPNIIGGSLSGADLSENLKGSLRLHCPSGLRQAGEICVGAAHTGDPLLDAVKTCASAGLRLPTLPELALVFEHEGAPEIAEWVADYSDDNGTITASKGVVLSENSSRQLSVGSDSVTQPYHYRCVTSATN